MTSTLEELTKPLLHLITVGFTEVETRVLVRCASKTMRERIPSPNLGQWKNAQKQRTHRLKYPFRTRFGDHFAVDYPCPPDQSADDVRVVALRNGEGRQLEFEMVLVSDQSSASPFVVSRDGSHHYLAGGKWIVNLTALRARAEKQIAEGKSDALGQLEVLLSLGPAPEESEPGAGGQYFCAWQHGLWKVARETTCLCASPDGRTLIALVEYWDKIQSLVALDVSQPMRPPFQHLSPAFTGPRSHYWRCFESQPAADSPAAVFGADRPELRGLQRPQWLPDGERLQFVARMFRNESSGQLHDQQAGEDEFSLRTPVHLLVTWSRATGDAKHEVVEPRPPQRESKRKGLAQPPQEPQPKAASSSSASSSEADRMREFKEAAAALLQARDAAKAASTATAKAGSAGAAGEKKRS